MLKLHPCEHCGRTIPVKPVYQPPRYHSVYNSLRFCGKKCAGAARRAETAAKVRRTCSAPGCSNNVAEGNLMLCSPCFTGENQRAEMNKGDAYTEDNIIHYGSIEPIIEGMRTVLKSRAKIVSAKDYTQSDLEYYLKHGTLPPQIERERKCQRVEKGL